MAIEVYANAYVTINGVNLSDHSNLVRANWGQETRDATAHSTAGAQRVFRTGLATRSLEATFFNDYAATNVETTLRGTIVGTTSTGVAVEVRAKNAVVSATNPRYYGDAVLDGDLMTVDSAVGELQAVTVRFQPYGLWTVSTSSTT